MSDASVVTNNSSNVVAQTQAVTTNQVNVAGSVTSNSSGGASSSTTVKDMNDLKKQAPEVYDAMMKGIAQQVCSSMQNHQDRLKRMMQEARRDNGG